jgi:hypothetical protein
MRKILVLFVLVTTWLPGRAECRTVGGTISTNFLNRTTTFGSATGDLSGGVGVTVLSETQNSNGTLTFHNQHHWVTASGDTINQEPANATGFPTGVTGLFAVSYLNGVVITGGTGRFKNATGKVFAWGAVDTSEGEVVLRYEGVVCFAGAD